LCAVQSYGAAAGFVIGSGTDGSPAVYNWHVEPALIDEAESLERALDGDADSFGLLVERHQEVAFRTAYLVLRDAAAAEDAAQDAFIRAYRKLPTFRRGEPFRPWLLRIVTNVALNAARARRRRLGVTERFGTLLGRNVDAPHVAIEDADATAGVLAAVNELPEDDRIVLYLRYFVELPEREIAAVLGRPAGTVKSRLHRAGGRLRTVIEQRYPWLREAFDA
jgi:RNA polymerase sigma-70 factor (ECF subfamily)